MNYITIISLLHTHPQNEVEVGFNSGLITVLKLLSENSEMELNPEMAKLRAAIGTAANFNAIPQKAIDSIIECKLSGRSLQAVKELKEATGLGLREAKDIFDEYRSK